MIQNILILILLITSFMCFLYFYKDEIKKWYKKHKKQFIGSAVVVVGIIAATSSILIPTGNNPPAIDVKIPEPATSGFILDAYDTSWINVSVNQSHFHFENNYINQSLKHIDFFVPEALQDDMGYVTPCNPSLMVCQRGNAPDPIYGMWDLFHVLNDWTNNYGNRFYIETDYIFNYDMYDNDNDIPDGFEWYRINQEIRINYSSNNSGIGDLLNTVIDLDSSHSIRINVSAEQNNLVLNYTYFYNDNITGQFEDSYLSYIPPESDDINFYGRLLNVSVSRNSSNMIIHSNSDYLTFSYNDSCPCNDYTSGHSISGLKFEQNYSDYNISYYPFEDDNNSYFEYLITIENPISFNTFIFDYFTSLNSYQYDNDGLLFRNHTSGGWHNFNMIYLPQPIVFDNDGNYTNANISIVNDKILMKIPQSFLDDAVYPVFVDPTWTTPSSVSSYSSQTDTYGEASFSLDEDTSFSQFDCWVEYSSDDDGVWYITYDLGDTYNVQEIRIYADGDRNGGIFDEEFGAPCCVNIVKVCDDSGCSGESDVLSGSSSFSTTGEWQEVDITDTNGRYIYVEGDIYGCTGMFCSPTCGGGETMKVTSGGDYYGVAEFDAYVSEIASDTSPPTPDPLTWSSDPDDDSSSAISMTSTTASDDNTISYQFNETGGGSGATNSGWQESDTTYTDSGLSENTQYTYKCQAKDSEGNIGNWSTEKSVYTACNKPEDAEVTIDSYGTNWIKVYVDECPNPTSDSTDCYIDCTSGGASDADYGDTLRENSHFYYNFTGLSSGTEYCFKAKYRNGDGQATSLNNNAECQTTESSVIIYNTTIRNDGIDYFVWLGSNESADDVVLNITGFDEASEYIGIWNNGTWSDTDANWDYYYGDTSGTDFNVYTFDVIQIYLTDSGTTTFDMTKNSDMIYTNSISYTWDNTSVNKGYNYTGFNHRTNTTLSAINTSVTLQDGEAIALWNETNYTWDWWLPGFSEVDKDVYWDDVILSKVEDNEVWNT